VNNIVASQRKMQCGMRISEEIKQEVQIENGWAGNKTTHLNYSLMFRTGSSHQTARMLLAV
jgi:hypothetical protein